MDRGRTSTSYECRLPPIARAAMVGELPLHCPIIIATVADMGGVVPAQLADSVERAQVYQGGERNFGKELSQVRGLLGDQQLHEHAARRQMLVCVVLHAAAKPPKLRRL